MSARIDEGDDRKLLQELWAENRMTLDRSLLQLSAAGIGLLVTLLTTVATWRGLELLIYLAAALFFLGTIVLCLWIFRKNCEYLEAILRGKARKPNLRCLDRLSFGFFVAALVLSLFAAAVTCYLKGP